MIQIPQTEIEFRNALIDAAEVGARKALIDVGVISPMMKLTDAYRMYGKHDVDKWIRMGLVRKIKDGDRNHAVRIDRMEIAGVAKVAQREAFFQTFSNTNEQ